MAALLATSSGTAYGTDERQLSDPLRRRILAGIMAEQPLAPSSAMPREAELFERYTDRSRRVLILAQEEARLLNKNFIGTEHLLLGLIREGDGVAAVALESLGIRLEAARQIVEQIVGRGQYETPGSKPFTPRAKKILELSLREALGLGDNYIDTEHLLLALVREGDGVAVEVLRTLGGSLTRVREEVSRTRSEMPSETLEPRQEGTNVHYLQEVGRDSPRCGSCHAALDDNLGYRVLAVPPGDPSAQAEPIDVVFVYCLTCGAVVGHHPHQRNDSER